MYHELERDVMNVRKTHGSARCRRFILEGIAKGDFRGGDFSLRNLVEDTIPDGGSLLRTHSPNSRGLYEAVPDAVDTSAFTEITGQFLFAEILAGLETEELMGDELVTTRPSNVIPAERIPGIAAASNEAQNEVPEGKSFPLVGLTQQYVMAPRQEVHGEIIGLTWQTVLADLTGLLIERARSIGIGVLIEREKMILRCVLGLLENNYSRNGEVRNAYGIAAENMGFLNEDDANLVDFSDIQEAEIPLRAMNDPNTSEPLMVNPKILLCSQETKWIARRLIHATEVRTGDITAAPAQQIIEVNPIPYPAQLKLLGSEYATRLILAANTVGGIVAAARANALLYWYLGDFKKAFGWREARAFIVEEEPTNAIVQFERNIWMRFKAWFCGQAYVREPRHVIRVDGTG